jgi:hypothetical protein
LHLRRGQVFGTDLNRSEINRGGAAVLGISKIKPMMVKVFGSKSDEPNVADGARPS